MIKEALKQRVEIFKQIGHFPLFEMFILRNGVEMPGSPRPKGVKKMTDKECFYNTTQLTFKQRWEYYEGMAINKNIGLPIHHAWNVKDGKVIDATWMEPQNCHYMGVHMPIDKLAKVLSKTKVYGVFDTGILNLELIFEIDPDLEKLWKQYEGREGRA